jgi:hypothetical protein
MICAILPLHLYEGATAGLETCGIDAPVSGCPIAITFRTLKRTKQEGRIPPHAVTRAKFCYHSLQRISIFYITRRRPQQVPQDMRFLKTLKSATLLE